MKNILIISILGIVLFALGLLNGHETCREYTDGLCECTTLQGYPFQSVLWPFDTRIDAGHHVMLTAANFFIAVSVAFVLWFITKKALGRMRASKRM